MPELYRYFNTSSYDDSPCYLNLQILSVVKETEKGYWIVWDSKRKFILKGPGKRWAYETKELAMQSFTIRKNRQLMHAKRTIARAEHSLKLRVDNIVEWEVDNEGHCTRPLNYNPPSVMKGFFW